MRGIGVPMKSTVPFVCAAACRTFGSSPPTPQAPNQLSPPYTPPPQGSGVKKKEAMTAKAMHLRLTPKSGARGNHTCFPIITGKRISWIFAYPGTGGGGGGVKHTFEVWNVSC